MEHILDSTGLIINDSYGRRTFSRIIGINGIPNYFETGKKPKAIEEYNINEVYFIPIEISDYKKYHRKDFYGYKYLFTLGQHDIIRIGNEQLPIDMSHVQMCVDVCRFEYRVNKNLEIRITKTYDPLYPTRVIDIQCLTKDVALYVLNQTIQCVNEFNLYYLDKKV